MRAPCRCWRARGCTSCTRRRCSTGSWSKRPACRQSRWRGASSAPEDDTDSRHTLPPSGRGASTPAAEPPLSADWLAQATRDLSNELFALPAWSPLYSVAQAAAAAASQSSERDVESILASLVANLQERFFQASKFPLAEAVQAHKVQPVEAGPGDEELRAITTEILQLQQRWPNTPRHPTPLKTQPAEEQRETGDLTIDPSAATSDGEVEQERSGYNDSSDVRSPVAREDGRMRAIDDRSTAPSLHRFFRMLASSAAREAAESIPLPGDVPLHDTSAASTSPSSSHSSSPSSRPMVRHTSRGPLGASTFVSKQPSASSAMRRKRAMKPVLAASSRPASPPIALSSPLLPMPRSTLSRPAVDQPSTSSVAAQKGVEGKRERKRKATSEKKDPFHGGWM